MQGHEAELDDLNGVIELFPDKDGLIRARGRVYLALGEYSWAAADFDRVLKLRPDDEDAIRRRGIAHHSLGHFDQALADFNRVIELDTGVEWMVAAGRKIEQVASRAHPHPGYPD